MTPVLILGDITSMQQPTVNELVLFASVANARLNAGAPGQAIIGAVGTLLGQLMADCTPEDIAAHLSSIANIAKVSKAEITAARAANAAMTKAGAA